MIDLNLVTTRGLTGTMWEIPPHDTINMIERFDEGADLLNKTR
jgi:hypothetical protein